MLFSHYENRNVAPELCDRTMLIYLAFFFTNRVVQSYNKATADRCKINIVKCPDQTCGIIYKILLNWMKRKLSLVDAKMSENLINFKDDWIDGKRFSLLLKACTSHNQSKNRNSNSCANGGISRSKLESRYESLYECCIKAQDLGFKSIVKAQHFKHVDSLLIMAYMSQFLTLESSHRNKRTLNHELTQKFSSIWKELKKVPPQEEPKNHAFPFNALKAEIISRPKLRAVTINKHRSKSTGQALPPNPYTISYSHPNMIVAREECKDWNINFAMLKKNFDLPRSRPELTSKRNLLYDVVSSADNIVSKLQTADLPPPHHPPESCHKNGIKFILLNQPQSLVPVNANIHLTCAIINTKDTPSSSLNHIFDDLIHANVKPVIQMDGVVRGDIECDIEIDKENQNNILNKSDHEQLINLFKSFNPSFLLHRDHDDDDDDTQLNLNNQYLIHKMILPRNSRIFQLSYTIKYLGEYELHLSYDNVDSSNDIFILKPTTLASRENNKLRFKTYDLNKVMLTPLKFCILNQPAIFLISAKDAGPGKLEVIINGGKVQSKIKNLGNKQFAVEFVPQKDFMPSISNSKKDPRVNINFSDKPIFQYIDVKFNGQDIPGNVFKWPLFDPSRIELEGRALQDEFIRIKHPVSFTLKTFVPTMDSQDLKIVIDHLSSSNACSQVPNTSPTLIKPVIARLSPMEQAIFSIHFSLPRVGMYSLSICIAATNNFEIKSSNYGSENSEISETNSETLPTKSFFPIKLTQTNVKNFLRNASNASSQFKDRDDSNLILKAFDPTQIVVGGRDILSSPDHITWLAACGDTFTLPIEILGNAGEGQLEITVDDGTLPNVVKLVSNSCQDVDSNQHQLTHTRPTKTCLLSFEPVDRYHAIDVKFNGTRIPDSPFKIYFNYQPSRNIEQNGITERQKTNCNEVDEDDETNVLEVLDRAIYSDNSITNKQYTNKQPLSCTNWKITIYRLTDLNFNEENDDGQQNDDMCQDIKNKMQKVAELENTTTSTTKSHQKQNNIKPLNIKVGQISVLYFILDNLNLEEIDFDLSTNTSPLPNDEIYYTNPTGHIPQFKIIPEFESNGLLHSNYCKFFLQFQLLYPGSYVFNGMRKTSNNNDHNNNIRNPLDQMFSIPFKASLLSPEIRNGIPHLILINHLTINKPPALKYGFVGEDYTFQTQLTCYANKDVKELENIDFIIQYSDTANNILKKEVKIVKTTLLDGQCFCTFKFLPVGEGFYDLKFLSKGKSLKAYFWKRIYIFPPRNFDVTRFINSFLNWNVEIPEELNQNLPYQQSNNLTTDHMLEPFELFQRSTLLKYSAKGVLGLLNEQDQNDFNSLYPNIIFTNRGSGHASTPLEFETLKIPLNLRNKQPFLPFQAELKVLTTDSESADKYPVDFTYCPTSNKYKVIVKRDELPPGKYILIVNINNIPLTAVFIQVINCEAIKIHSSSDLGHVSQNNNTLSNLIIDTTNAGGYGLIDVHLEALDGTSTPFETFVLNDIQQLAFLNKYLLGTNGRVHLRKLLFYKISTFTEILFKLEINVYSDSDHNNVDNKGENERLYGNRVLNLKNSSAFAYTFTCELLYYDGINIIKIPYKLPSSTSGDFNLKIRFSYWAQLLPLHPKEYLFLLLDLNALRNSLNHIERELKSPVILKFELLDGLLISKEFWVSAFKPTNFNVLALLDKSHKRIPDVESVNEFVDGMIWPELLKDAFQCQILTPSQRLPVVYEVTPRLPDSIDSAGLVKNLLNSSACDLGYDLIERYIKQNLEWTSLITNKIEQRPTSSLAGNLSFQDFVMAYSVNFVPCEVGEHTVSLLNKTPIDNQEKENYHRTSKLEFTFNVYDVQKIKLHPISPSIHSSSKIGELLKLQNFIPLILNAPCVFEIDVSKSGGCKLLDVMIIGNTSSIDKSENSSINHSIPNSETSRASLLQEDNTATTTLSHEIDFSQVSSHGKYRVTFIPEFLASILHIHVNVNNEPIGGSPFVGRFYPQTHYLAFNEHNIEPILPIPLSSADTINKTNLGAYRHIDSMENSYESSSFFPSNAVVPQEIKLQGCHEPDLKSHNNDNTTTTTTTTNNICIEETCDNKSEDKYPDSHRGDIKIRMDDSNKLIPVGIVGKPLVFTINTETLTPDIAIMKHGQHPDAFDEIFEVCVDKEVKDLKLIPANQVSDHEGTFKATRVSCVPLNPGPHIFYLTNKLTGGSVKRKCNIFMTYLHQQNLCDPFQESLNNVNEELNMTLLTESSEPERAASQISNNFFAVAKAFVLQLPIEFKSKHIRFGCFLNFKIFGPFQLSENDINIHDENDSIFRVAPNSDYGLDVKCIPKVVGEIKVYLKRGDVEISGSPLTIYVFDPNQIFIRDLKKTSLLTSSHHSAMENGLAPSTEQFFTIDARGAGIGNLEILICCEGRPIPNRVEMLTTPNQDYHLSTKHSSSNLTSSSNGTRKNHKENTESNFNQKKKIFRVYFTPTKAALHTIDIKFNNQMITGSPFMIMILDPMQFKLNGELNILNMQMGQEKKITLFVPSHYIPFINFQQDFSCYLKALPKYRQYYTILHHRKLTNLVLESHPDNVLQSQCVNLAKDCKNLTDEIDSIVDPYIPICEFVFKPSNILPGPYELCLEFNGEVISHVNLNNKTQLTPNSHIFQIFDVKAIKIQKFRSSVKVNNINHFYVDTSMAGQGYFESFIYTNVSKLNEEPLNDIQELSRGLEFIETNTFNLKIPISVNSNKMECDGNNLESTFTIGYEVSYITNCCGKHVVSLTFNGQTIPGSPLEFTGHKHKNTFLWGPGLSSFPYEQLPAYFWIDLNRIGLENHNFIRHISTPSAVLNGDNKTISNLNNGHNTLSPFNKSLFNSVNDLNTITTKDESGKANLSFNSKTQMSVGKIQTNEKKQLYNNHKPSSAAATIHKNFGFFHKKFKDKLIGISIHDRDNNVIPWQTSFLSPLFTTRINNNEMEDKNTVMIQYYPMHPCKVDVNIKYLSPKRYFESPDENCFVGDVNGSPFTVLIYQENDIYPSSPNNNSRLDNFKILQDHPEVINELKCHCGQLFSLFVYIPSNNSCIRIQPPTVTITHIKRDFNEEPETCLNLLEDGLNDDLNKASTIHFTLGRTSVKGKYEISFTPIQVGAYLINAKYQTHEDDVETLTNVTGFPKTIQAIQMGHSEDALEPFKTPLSSGSTLRRIFKAAGGTSSVASSAKSADFSKNYNYNRQHDQIEAASSSSLVNGTMKEEVDLSIENKQIPTRTDWKLEKEGLLSRCHPTRSSLVPAGNEKKYEVNVDQTNNFHQSYTSTLKSSPGKQNGRPSSFDKKPKCTAASALTPEVEGRGLYAGKVGCLTSFNLRHIRPDQDIDVLITGPDRSFVPCRCYYLERDTYTVEYQPELIGFHKIEVTLDKIPIPGNPYTCKIIQPDAIKIQTFPHPRLPPYQLTVGEEFNFLVDCSEAGVAELKARIRLKTPGTEALTKCLKEEYSLKILPFDPRLTNFVFSNPGKSNLMFDNNYKTIQQQMDMSMKNKKYPNHGELKHIRFIPKISGNFLLSLVYGEYVIKDCPFSFKVCLRGHSMTLEGEGLHRGLINKPCNFKIFIKEVGGCEEESQKKVIKPKISIEGPNTLPSFEISQQGNIPSPSYTVTYSPSEIGLYSIIVTLDNEDLNFGPYLAKICEPGNMKLISPFVITPNQTLNNQQSLSLNIYEMARFIFDAGHCGPGTLGANIQVLADMHTKLADVKLFEIESSSSIYTLTFKTELYGDYFIHLTWNEYALAFSPLTGKCEKSKTQSTTPKQVLNHENKLDQQQNKGHHHNDLLTRAQYTILKDMFTKCFTTYPTSNQMIIVEGLETEYPINCQIKISIDISPLITYIRSQMEHIESFVDKSLKEDVLKNFNAPILRISNEDYHSPSPSTFVFNSIVKLSLSTYVYTFKLNVKGKYSIIMGYNSNYILCNWTDELNLLNYNNFTEIGNESFFHISQSPHHFKGIGGTSSYNPSPQLQQNNNSSLTNQKCLETEPLIVPNLITSCIGDTENTLDSINNIVSDDKGNSHPSNASKVKVYGTGIHAGVLGTFDSRFTIDTKGACAGQLTVKIRGPKSAFHVHMKRDGKRDRIIHCHYDPTEVGDYTIHVTWSSIHVTGSPFSVVIFDTLVELNEWETRRKLQTTTTHHNTTTGEDHHNKPLNNRNSLKSISNCGTDNSSPNLNENVHTTKTKDDALNRLKQKGFAYFVPHGDNVGTSEVPCIKNHSNKEHEDERNLEKYIYEAFRNSSSIFASHSTNISPTPSFRTQPNNTSNGVDRNVTNGFQKLSYEEWKNIN